MNTRTTPDMPVIQNRRARHDYHILETFECGIVLSGTEVKSIRAGHLLLGESYVEVRNQEIFLKNAFVEEYEMGNRFNHIPQRDRKLLAKKPEIMKMHNAASLKGLTLIPLKAYFKGSFLKVEVGIGRGKKEYDKRHDKAAKEAKREMDRALKQAGR